MPGVVVVGAGAAGTMAAIFASTGGAKTLLLERTSDGGRKILISGGGRCNVLPSVPAPARFVSRARPALVRALLNAWPLREQIRYFEDVLGVPLALESGSGKYFPASDRARDVRDALVARATRLGVALRFGVPVRAVVPASPGWRVTMPDDVIEADRVVIATGGLSVPATGSTGFGFEVAGAVGHTVHPPFPALTPLTAEPAVHAALAGVSLNVSLVATSPEESARASGGFLFTHRGYSGPAVLDISHVAVRSLLREGPRAAVRVRWTSLDAAAWTSELTQARTTVTTAVSRQLPHRLAEHLVDHAGIASDRACAQLRRDERLALIARLTDYDLPWTGHEGYRPAEVTGGGVSLDEVGRQTLESRRAAGLFFCGEVLDAFGPIGGHNFQWAWSTGRVAGRGAAA
jgi:predicted Rossmann fold flavoprotein